MEQSPTPKRSRIYSDQYFMDSYKSGKAKIDLSKQMTDLADEHIVAK